MQYENARNQLSLVMNGFADQSSINPSEYTYERFVDLSSAIKQLGITDMEQIDQLIADINKVTSLIDDTLVPEINSVGVRANREKVNTVFFDNQCLAVHKG